MAAKHTPAAVGYLVLLREIVSHQIRTRHRLVCGMSDARRAVAGLRNEYKRLEVAACTGSQS